MYYRYCTICFLTQLSTVVLLMSVSVQFHFDQSKHIVCTELSWTERFWCSCKEFSAHFRLSMWLFSVECIGKSLFSLTYKNNSDHITLIDGPISTKSWSSSDNSSDRPMARFYFKQVHGILWKYFKFHRYWNALIHQNLEKKNLGIYVQEFLLAVL